MGVDESISTDVLIIGAGGAGLRAAIAAAETGAQVISVAKSAFPGGCSVHAGGSHQASFGWLKKDSKEAHFKDTITGGCYLNDQVLVRILVEEAPRRIVDLERYGAVLLRKSENRYVQRLLGGYSVERAVSAKRQDHVVRVLYDKAASLGVKLIDETMATRLIIDNRGNVAGATCLDIKNGEFRLISSKSTIIASGGLGGIYYISTNTRSITGDGFALAHSAGAEMVNMEMVQFVPLGYLYPEFSKGQGLGVASAWGPKTKYLNAQGERYILKYDHKDQFEATTRDIISRANYEEIRRGRGTARGGIIVDHTENDPSMGYYQLHQWPHRYRLIKDLLGRKVVDYKERFEATPTQHYSMGGIKIFDGTCQTSLSGLYVCGEASTNIHGANRLGGNSLTDLQVFGARAGEHAGKASLKKQMPFVEDKQIDEERKRILSILEKAGNIRPTRIKRRIQGLMWSNVGIVKTSRDLQRALAELKRIKTKSLPEMGLTAHTTTYNVEWVEALEIYSILDVAEMVTRCAISRKESRGAHFCTDYPAQDNKNFLKETILTKVDGVDVITTRPVRMTEMFLPK